MAVPTGRCITDVHRVRCIMAVARRLHIPAVRVGLVAGIIMGVWELGVAMTKTP